MCRSLVRFWDLKTALREAVYCHSIIIVIIVTVRYCGMLAAQGGHTVLLDLVREPSTHSKVANITDQVMTQHCDCGTMSLSDCLSAGSEYNSGAWLAASG